MRRFALYLSLFAIVPAAAMPPVDSHLKVDQAGYRPTAAKLAVISDPQVGFNAPDPFTPASTYELRRLADDAIVYQGPVAAWSSGALHVQSGDIVSWFDFSSFQTTGDYYVYDPTNAVASQPFTISKTVYNPLLKLALHSFYYQRCGSGKAAAFAGTNWTDTACHLGAEQDLDCRDVLNPVPSTSRDLSGGWHDAGDYNKYINFADRAIHDLLGAWEDTPAAFTDTTNLPESGNGIPDILDEVRWELDFFLKMQLSGGSVLHKVSVTDFASASPPSQDTAKRRYAGPTASATISACGAFAHGAIVFDAFPATQSYAATLRQAALAAWGWLEANPGSIPSNYQNTGFQNAAAEDTPYEQATNRICAAAYLYVLTGDPKYRTYVDQNYASTHLIQWNYAYAFESEYQDGLLYYGRAPGATASVKQAIEAAFRSSVKQDSLPHYTAGDDPYMAYLDDADYVWGSTAVKAATAGLYLRMLSYGLDPPNSATYRSAAAGYVHYLFGVNPLGYGYMTDDGSSGLDNPILEIYHGWFADGTDWDNSATSLYGPAPGFFPGGVNPSYAPDPTYGGPPIEPPMNQPIQKSYRDWNTSFPENSWSVTENDDYYQAAVIRLLAAYAAGAAAGDDILVGPGPGAPNPNEVKLFTGAGQQTVVDFYAYAAGGYGTNLAGGEPDGSPRILTGPGPGAVFGPQFRAFDRTGDPIAKVNFYAYGTLRFGVNPESGRVDGDSFDELLSGAGRGAVFGPHVRGFDYDGKTLRPIAKISFFAYKTLKYGVIPASGDIEGDAFDEIVTTPGPGVVFGPQVRGFDYDGSAITGVSGMNFFAPFPMQYGARSDGADVTADGSSEILVAPGPNPAATARVIGYTYNGTKTISLQGFDIAPFSSPYGASVGGGDAGGSSADDLLVTPGPDPASSSEVRAYTYSAGAATALPVAFVAYPTMSYGARLDGGPLGY